MVSWGSEMENAICSFMLISLYLMKILSFWGSVCISHDNKRLTYPISIESAIKIRREEEKIKNPNIRNGDAYYVDTIDVDWENIRLHIWKTDYRTIAWYRHIQDKCNTHAPAWIFVAWLCIDKDGFFLFPQRSSWRWQYDHITTFGWVIGCRPHSLEDIKNHMVREFVEESWLQQRHVVDTSFLWLIESHAWNIGFVFVVRVDVWKDYINSALKERGDGEMRAIQYVANKEKSSFLREIADQNDWRITNIHLCRELYDHYQNNKTQERSIFG